MVLFQPAAGPPPGPWMFGFDGYPNSQMIEVTLWIGAIVAFAFALLLLVSYFTTRKPEHFFWGIAFALLWINLHLLIPLGDFEYLLNPLPAAFSALTLGLFAVGLWKNVKPEQKLIGDLLLAYVVGMSVLIMFLKNNLFGVEYFGTQLIDPIYVSIVVMALHVPSAALILWLPIQTREENGNATWAMVTAGVIMGLVGILIRLASLFGYSYPYDGMAMVVDINNYALVGYLFVILSVFPFAMTFAIIAFAWGTFVPKRWGFVIPGIELEESVKESVN